jgi:CMP-N,N'-diacetyllegionaminic acid synthase
MSQVLGIIPARGGSKGIPNKNLKPLAGRPLLAYTADAARESGVIDRLILSTDSREIAQLGASLGIEVPFLRPADLARDESAMLPVLEHAVAEIEQTGWKPDVVVLLQPTAPLRRPEHVKRAVEMLEKSGCDSVVSVIEIPSHYAPHFAMKIVNGRLDYLLPEGRHITRRQDVEPAYSRDGTVYTFRRDVLMEQHTIYGLDCRPIVLPLNESVNLDSREDWEEAERILSKERRPA